MNRCIASLFQFNNTYGDLFFIQGGSDSAPEYCKTGFGKKHSLLFSAAVQNRYTALL